MVRPVWFWQRTISPHMAGLASALADSGVPTTYVAERTLSADREAQGWEVSPLGQARLAFAPDRPAVRALVAEAPADSVHICQGLRANGLIGTAQRALAARAIEQWVVMETVDDSGWRGWVKRGLYRAHLRAGRFRASGLLASGADTPDWLVRRGARPDRTFPFAYFLSDAPPRSLKPAGPDTAFRFVFVGQFIERKRLDLLVGALSRIENPQFELVVAGSGPLEGPLRDLAVRRLGSRVTWLGRQTRSAIPDILSSADCLVLPSRFDGWGAVASEALLVGTPVVCSDGCGCRDVVRLSGGDVFAAGDEADLAATLASRMEKGRPHPHQRAGLRLWAKCLGGEAGADYLKDILAFVSGRRGEAPTPPWRSALEGGGHAPS